MEIVKVTGAYRKVLLRLIVHDCFWNIREALISTVLMDDLLEGSYVQIPRVHHVHKVQVL
jgi:hypothetical protein